MRTTTWTAALAAAFAAAACSRDAVEDEGGFRDDELDEQADEDSDDTAGEDDRDDDPDERPGRDAGVGDDDDVVSDESGPVRGRRVDLLFVIDNSNSMQSEQELLARQFPLLARALADLPGGLPDLQVGVISTDLGSGNYSLLTCEAPGGDRGELRGQARGDCSGPSPEPYIRAREEGGGVRANVRDVAGPGPGGCIDEPDGALDACDVAAAFECIARLGVGGCGFEQPMEAMVRALCRGDRDFDYDGDGEPEWDPPAGYCAGGEQAPNGEFLREGSLLVVAFIGDEDDCSAARGELYDPSQTDRLGPLKSFRCFEFGARCGDRCAYDECRDGTIQRVGGQQLRDCRPVESRDAGGDAYLFPVSRYARFLRRLRAPGRLLVAAITGPWRDGDIVTIEQDRMGNPDVAPSCFGPGAEDQAAPALRFRSLLDGLGDDGVFGQDVNAAICSDDFAPALDALADRIGDAEGI